MLQGQRCSKTKSLCISILNGNVSESYRSSDLTTVVYTRNMMGITPTPKMLRIDDCQSGLLYARWYWYGCDHQVRHGYRSNQIYLSHLILWEEQGLTSRRSNLETRFYTSKVKKHIPTIGALSSWESSDTTVYHAATTMVACSRSLSFLS